MSDHCDHTIVALYSWDRPFTWDGGQRVPGSLPAVRVLRQLQWAHTGFASLLGGLQDDRAAAGRDEFNQMELRCRIGIQSRTLQYLSDWDDDRVCILFSSCLQKTQERSGEMKRDNFTPDRHDVTDTMCC